MYRLTLFLYECQSALNRSAKNFSSFLIMKWWIAITNAQQTKFNQCGTYMHDAKQSKNTPKYIGFRLIAYNPFVLSFVLSVGIPTLVDLPRLISAIDKRIIPGTKNAKPAKCWICWLISNEFTCPLKNGNTAQTIILDFARFWRIPQGCRAVFALSREGRVFELQSMHMMPDSKRASWFMGNQTISDGVLYTLTAIDPLFLALPSLVQSRKKVMQSLIS